MTERNPPATQEGMSQAGNTIVTIEHREWSGPLPAPEIVAQFDDAVPGSGERIFKEWETEAGHRRSFDGKVLNAEIFDRILGRILSFLFSITALATTAYCASTGAYWAATIVGGAAAASVLPAFVLRTATNARSGSDGAQGAQ